MTGKPGNLAVAPNQYMHTCWRVHAHAGEFLPLIKKARDWHLESVGQMTYSYNYVS